MFKVSFKEAKRPSKVTIKRGNDTKVIIQGLVKLPKFFDNIPPEISDWISSRKKVEIYENMATHTLIIYSTGKVRCRPEDKYDTILGERLAESKAKRHIYKFFFDLCSKLFDYYGELLYGNAIVDPGSGNCLVNDLRKYETLYHREIDHFSELLNSPQ